MNIITRAEAKALGLKRYFLGSQCKHGHVAERSTINGSCMECGRLKQERLRREDIEKIRLIQKKFRAKPDAKEKNRAYLHRVKPERGAKMAILYADREARALAFAEGRIKYISNFTCPKGHVGERFSKNGKCVECNRILCSIKEEKRRGSKEEADRKRAHYELNKSLYSERARSWARKNPEKARACFKANQAQRRTVEKAGDAPYVVLAWEKAALKVCYWCGVKCKRKYHVDHYVALSKGGKHEISNLVIACPTCNLRKSAKDPLVFAASMGSLF